MRQYLLTTLCLLSLFVAGCTSSLHPREVKNGTDSSTVKGEITNGTDSTVKKDETRFDLKSSTPQVILALKCQVDAMQCKSAPIKKIPYYISFYTNKASLNEKGHKALEELSEAFKREKSLFERNRLIIAGHTDSRGSPQYNRKLSEKRALTVKDYLSDALDIDDSHFIVKGYGEDRLKIKNDNTPQERAINRRVEFTLYSHSTQ